MNLFHDVHTAASTVFADSTYRWLALGIFLTVLGVYAVVLPATYTGGRIGLVSLRLLTPTMAGFAIILSALIAILTAFSIYAYRQHGSACTTTATGGIIGSVLPSLLCCSPLLPAALGVLAAIFPAATGASGPIQGLIATHEPHILTGAAIVLIYAITKNAAMIQPRDR